MPYPSNRFNCLPGVPNVESPFFDDLFDPADPRYPIALSLREKGFAVIDFPDDQVEQMAGRIKNALHNFYDWKKWDAGQYADMRIMDAWEFNSDVRRIACSEQIIDLLAYLYGRPAFPFQTLNFPVGTQQHYHTDSLHFSSLPERFMCGVWLALEDIGPDQGPLVYYPGSHKWPIYTREHIGIEYNEANGRHQSTFEPLWEQLVAAHGIEPQYFFPRKGQALIWAANLLHGGIQHADRGQTRWSQVTHYYFDDCVYYTPLASNEPRGEYYQRAPYDIRNGHARPSTYMNQLVNPSEANLPPREILIPDAFDKESYLSHNPDVAEAGLDPWKHYVDFGHSEGRKW